MKSVNTTSAVFRFSTRARHLLRASAMVLSAVAFAGVAHAAANTAVVVAPGANVDLSVSTNYTPNGTPGTTNDVNFSGATSSATVNGTNLNIGTLDDNTSTALVISNSNATAATITLNTAQNSVSGTAGDLLFTKSGGTLTLQNGTGTLTLDLAATGNIDTAGTLNILTSPITLNSGITTTFTGTGHANIGSIDSAGATTAAVTVSNGTVTFSGTNAYTGLTTVSGGTLVVTGTGANGGLTQSGGTLSVNSATALGTGTFTINGGTINNTTGSAITESTVTPIVFGGTNNFSLGATGNTGGIGNINFGTGAVSLAGSRAITLNGTGATFTFAGAAANTTTGGVTTTVTGAGNSLVFTGSYTLGGNSNNANSTFSGNGNVSLLGAVQNFTATTQSLNYTGTGTLTLGGADIYTGLTNITGGTLALDFSQAAAPTTNIINHVANSSSLSLGSALTIKGASGVTNSQSFPNVFLTGANDDTITVIQNGATSVNLAMGNLHRSLDSTTDFTLPTAGTVTTTASGAEGVISFAAANGGATWATFDIPTGTIGALGTYSTGVGSYTAGNNVDVANGDTVAGVTVNTLRFNSAGETLNLSGANTITDGVLVTPTATGTTSITGGTIQTNNPANELVFQNYGGTLNIGSTITDNGSPTSVTIGGTGTTIFSGSNTYTGLTTLTGGTLSLNGSNLSLSALSGGINSTIALGSNELYITSGASNAVFSGVFTSTSGISSGTVVKTGTGAEYIENPLGLTTSTYAGGIEVAAGWLETNQTIGANANILYLGGGDALTGGDANAVSSLSATPTTLYLNGAISNNIDVNGGGTGALTMIGNGFIQSGVSSKIVLNDTPTFTISTFGFDYLGRNVTTGQLSEKGGITGAGNLQINSGATSAGGAAQFYNLPIDNGGYVNIVSLGGGTVGTGGGTNIGNGGAGAGLGSAVTVFVVSGNGGGLVDYMPENDSGFTGPIYINAGTLSDDTSQNNAATSNVTAATGLFNSAVSLNMGGGTFQFKGTGTGSFKTQDQVLNGLTLNAGSSTVDVDNPSGATLTTLDLRGAGGTKTITRNVGGTVNFTASVGTFGTTSVIDTASVNDAGGILGGYATVAGTSWATVTSNVIQSLATASYGTLGASTSTTNVDMGAGAQAASGLAANTLRFNAAATALTLTGTNVLTDGGILVTSSATGANSITGGTLEGASGADLVVIQNETASAFTIASTIADNTTATALTKSGTGTLFLTNTANTYSGSTYINAGILNVASLAANGTASSIGTGAAGSLVLNGGTLQYTGTTAATESNGYTLTTSGGTFDASGTLAGSLTVSGAMTVTGTSENVGGVSTDVGGIQDLNLTGTGTGTAGGFYSGVITNGSVSDDYTAVNKTGAGTWTLSGANTYTGFTTISAGTLVANNVSALGNLNGINVVNPATVVFSGTSTLDIATDTSINPYNVIQNTTGTATILVDRATSGAAVTQTLGSLSMSNGTFTASIGANVTSGIPLLTFNSLVLNNSGGGAYTLNANTADIDILGNVTATASAGGTQTLTLTSSNTGLSTITGSISDGINGGNVGITRSGGTATGIWVLSGANSFSGAVSITAGGLNLQNSSALGTGLGSSSSGVTVGNNAALQLQGGISTTTAVALNLNGTGLNDNNTGALDSISGNNTYTGLVTVGGTGVSIGSSTAGNTLTLSNTGVIGISNAGGTDTLTFEGAGNTTVDSSIDTGTPGKVVVGFSTSTPTGLVEFSNASTYGGGTTVNSGELAVNNFYGAGTSGVGTGAVSVTGVLGGGNGANNSFSTVTTPGVLATYGAGVHAPSFQNYQTNTVGVLTASVTVNNGGNITPGNNMKVGTLSLTNLASSGNLTLSSGSSLTYYFNSTNDSNSLISVAGFTLAAGTGTTTVNLFNEGGTTPFTLDGTYNLVEYASGSTLNNATTDVNGNLLNFAVATGSQTAGLTYTFVNDTTDDIVQLDITGTVAPEPSSWGMMLGGLGLLVVISQWRRIGRRSE